MPDRTDAAPEAAALHAQATDDLRYIRDTMSRASTFTAVPGWGGVFIGITALGLAAFAGPPENTGRWVGLWLLEAVVAVTIGAIAVVRKAKRRQVPLTGAAARRFWFVFAPGILAGAVLTGVFVRAGWAARLPACWLLLYGVSVTSAGAFSVRPVRIMGMSFMALGMIAAIIPVRGGDALLAAGFGLLHIAFGVLIARNHGG